jgi:hypothetical protein
MTTSIIDDSKSSPASSSSASVTAAVDLIRSLDAALSGMSASARSASEDAARARRNAKAAGEVARRFGGGVVVIGGGGSGRRKKTNGGTGGGGDNDDDDDDDDDDDGGGGWGGGGDDGDGILERTRERRAAARMTARARQRRDHPMAIASSASSPPFSPRRYRHVGIASPTSRGGGGDVAETTAAMSAAMAPGGGNNPPAATPGVERLYYNDEALPPTTLAAGGVDDVVHLAHDVGEAATSDEFEDAVENHREYDQYHPEQQQEERERSQWRQYPDRPLGGGGQEVVSDQDGGGQRLGGAQQLQQQYSYHPSEEGGDQEGGGHQQGGAQWQHQYPAHSSEGGHDANDQEGGGQYFGSEYYYDQNCNEQNQKRLLPQKPNYHNGGGEYYTDQHGQQQSGGGEYYPDRHGHQQPQPSSRTVDAMASIPAPSATASASVPPPPAGRPTPQSNITTKINTPSRTAIEASHVEDVLTLSLELERARSQLATALRQLDDAASRGNALQARNDHLERELTTLCSRCESENERSASELSALRKQLQIERVKSKAAEEDATLALELAKESQSNKEECEMWLSRSLEEMDLWKGRYMELKEERRRGVDDIDGWAPDEPRKSVRFKDENGAEEDEYEEEEGCPPSPVRSVLSVDDYGYFGNDDNDVSHRATSTPSRPPPPPPPPPPMRPVDASMSLPVPQQVAMTKDDGVTGVCFSPVIASSSAFSSVHRDEDVATPLSKSTAIASGRALLHRAAAAASSSSSSPSPFKNGVGLSPHPRKQAHDLLKKSAETRRLLRERLTPGRRPVGGGSGAIPSLVAGSNAKKNDGISLNDDGFASRQGAACRAVGRAIRESGARLKLKGTWWSSRSSHNGNSALLGDDNHVDGATTQESHSIGEEGYGTVAQLESMVRDYCGIVEGTIGRQQTKIDELLAFCDHLEKEVAGKRS